MEDTAFKIANTAALTGWLCLALLPKWRGTRLIVHRGVLPFGLSVAYLGAIIAGFGEGDGNFATLDGVAELFTNRTVLLAGWIHYLAFDMLIGSRILIDSQRRSIGHIFVLPVLFFTFMFGPVGYVLYIVLVRLTRKNPGRQLGLMENGGTE